MHNMTLLHCAHNALLAIHRRIATERSLVSVLSPLRSRVRPYCGCGRVPVTLTAHTDFTSSSPSSINSYCVTFNCRSTKQCKSFKYYVPHRSFSNTNDNDDLTIHGRAIRVSKAGTNSEFNTLNIENDPDTKSLLKDIATDFVVAEENTSNNSLDRSEDDSSSSSESDSDSSSSSESDSDSSSSSESDSDSSSSSESDSSDSEAECDDNSPQRRGVVTPAEVDAELLKYDYEEFDDDIVLEEENIVEERVLPISTERGVTGVLDVDELVTLLRDESGRDLCVIRVAPELSYVDHMVLVSGRSTRHLRAMAELVQWVFKRKRGPHDAKSCRIEGLQSNEWYAMDLGNIALHLFLPDARRTYDLETLWTVGAAFDDKSAPEASDPYDGLFTEQHWLRTASRRAPDQETTDDQETTEDQREVRTEDHGPPETDYHGMESLAGWHDANDRSS